MMPKPRARDLGLRFPGTPGRHNAITDVPGVQVGYRTLISGGDGPLTVGRGPVRTGVTAILPRGRIDSANPVWAGFHALNGNGEMTGTHWIEDAGHFVGPICITNTHAVGIAHHAATRWMIDTHRDLYGSEHLWLMPVIAETYDGVLNDINGMHVGEADVRAAIDTAASGPIAEGNVGGGTGMICYEFKGGTGTASRMLAMDDGREHVVAALVQANHGLRDWLTVLGVPVGRELADDRLLEAEQGSIIVVLATDIPMLPHQLRRLARRGSIGIGRGGTPGGNNSGDIFLAFTTANRMAAPQRSAARQTFEAINDDRLDPVYRAAVEAIEEAVVNALVAAEDMVTLKPPGRRCAAIDHGALVAVLRRHGAA
ncbi:P1 family peptidase [Arenibaculum sp.]|uniref:DmpA family aminopeptidase n=1 Tax=Arenibaculum sp. TaxID=2865862 RepID=UPI002E12C1A4|nr:P1 family peptidase [Arenibaculum sp.]